jgi:ABC-2 type transport system ATP-binding protein
MARRRLRLPKIRWTRGRIIATAVVGILLLAWIVAAARPSRPAYRSTETMITVLTGPAGTTPVVLDTTFYLPRTASATHKVPAVLLAHGFGGTKRSVATQAQELAARGYAVLAWTAEGFGRSGGEIHLDSPDWEVRDGSRLLDWLAARPEIQIDAPGDPRVGVVGGSYGGAFTLLLAGTDHRVDAIVPQITWNDLANSFLPDAGGAGAVNGVFKKAWAGLFFASGATSINPAGYDPACGRFAADICQAYQSIAATGRATDAGVALLRKSSPASVLANIKAPTLLIQGEADSLFPLSEADANARGIAATGTPVRVAWFTGGHDGGTGPTSDQNRLRDLTYGWLDHYVAGHGPVPATSFVYSQVSGFDAIERGVVTTAARVDAYPGLSGTAATTSVSVTGPAQPIANPAGGNPAAITSLPGVSGGGLASFVNGVVTDLPGQHADFVSAPLTQRVEVVGAPSVQIKAASPTGEAVLFVKLYDVDPASGASLPDGLVAPVRLTGLPARIADARPITIQLPAIVHRFDAGHRLRITIATADQAYATPAQPVVYEVGVGDGTVRLPTVAGVPIDEPSLLWRYVLFGLLAALAVAVPLAIVYFRRRTRHADRSADPDIADVPLVVRGLRKAYDDGFVAVERFDFAVQRGQVVGLLGPNGAGKTTTLRVLLGLTRPTAGDIHIFGHRLSPGAPVLSRIGALVEGPGFMPHLSGAKNLELYWKSTGRPASEARMTEALDIAGLGDGIHRKVKTYSHGMKQRLAVAQAMLGLPELLVLDEPTDGLDPPQIAEMRRVLQRYATDGRAVLVSSHLLAEVEQTCTHVVVMHKGQKVADGPVADIVGDSPSVQFDVSDIPRAARVLAGLRGVQAVPAEDGRGLIVDVNGTPRADVVKALVTAGIGVDRVAPRRRLEDAFLTLVGGDTKASGER